MTHEWRRRTDVDEVGLAHLVLKLDGAVDQGLTNIYGRKQNQGDPGPDDHPVNSTSIQADWQGGMLVKDANPASDVNRFEYSDCETQFKGVIMLPPKTVVTPKPTAGVDAYDLGDFITQHYAAWGTNLYRWDESGFEWDLVGSIGVVPNAHRPGVTWRVQTGGSAGELRLYIAQGAGHAYTNGGVPNISGLSAVDFAVWDNKLFRITQNGELHWTLDGTTWTLITRLPVDHTPQRLISYLDRVPEPALWIITDGGTFILNFTAQILHQLDLEFPRTPNQGLGVTNHKGDLMVSVGIGIHRFRDGAISAIGLDGDDGLPPEFSGNIVAMQSSYNGMYVLVRGSAIGTGDTGESIASLDMGGEVSFEGFDTTNNNGVFVWNGFGWHFVWKNSGGTPKSMTVSQADGYRLYWSVGEEIYRQDLSTTYFNARLIEDRELERSCSHYTSWSDWGWKGSRKIMKVLEQGVESVVNDDRITVNIRFDRRSASFTEIGTIDAALINDPNGEGEAAWFLNQDVDTPVLPDGTKYFKGIPHSKWQMRFDFVGDPTTPKSSPRLIWHAAIGRKFLRPQETFVMVVNLTDSYKGQEPEWLYRELQKLVDFEGAHPFLIEGRYIMVDVVGLSTVTRVHTPDASKKFARLNLVAANERR